MQQKRNQIITNILLTTLTLITSVLLANRNTLSTIQDLNIFKFSTKTLLILSVTGVLFNFILSLVINYNVYKVLYRLVDIGIQGSSLYMFITLSLLISNSVLLILPQVKDISITSLLIQNMLSYIIFVITTCVYAMKQQVSAKSILTLCIYLLLFALIVNSVSIVSTLGSGLEELT